MPIPNTEDALSDCVGKTIKRACECERYSGIMIEFTDGSSIYIESPDWISAEFNMPQEVKANA